MKKLFMLICCVLFLTTSSVDAQRILLWNEGSANHFYLKYTAFLKQLPNKAIKPYICDFQLCEQQPSQPGYRAYQGYIDNPTGVSIGIIDKGANGVFSVFVSIYKEQVSNPRAMNLFKATIIDTLIVCGLEPLDAIQLCNSMELSDGANGIFFRKSYLTPKFDRNIGYRTKDNNDLFVTVFLSSFDDNF